MRVQALGMRYTRDINIGMWVESGDGDEWGIVIIQENMQG